MKRTLLTMICKLYITLFLLAGLSVCWTQSVTSTLISPTSSVASESVSPTDTASSSSSAPITPTPTPTSWSQSASPSTTTASESPRGHNQTNVNGREKTASTSPFSNGTSLQGSTVEPASVPGQVEGSVTQRSQTETMPATSFTSEETLTEDREGRTLRPSTGVGVSSTTVGFQSSFHPSSAQPKQPSSSSAVIETGADSAPKDSLHRTTLSLDTQPWPTPFFHTTVSDSPATRAQSDIFSFSASADGSMLSESLKSSSTPVWVVTGFTASWPDKDKVGSFHSTSSEFLPQTIPHSLGVSVASEEESFQFITSSQTASAILEPSSVVHFTSSTDAMIQTYSVQSTAYLPTATYSAKVDSSSVNSSTSSSLRDTQQTSDRLLSSQTSLYRSHAATTFASTSTFLSTDSHETSASTSMISASSTLPSATATEQTTTHSSPTPGMGATQTLTLPTNITTTPSTTTTTTPLRTTLPARRDVRYQFTLTGDCHLILNNTEFFQRFLAGFHDLIVKQLGIAEDTYRLGEISCGTVHVFITFLQVTMPDFDIRLQTIIRNGGPGLSIPVWIDSHFATFDLVHAKHVPLAPDEHTYNIVAEVMDDVDIIVIIVACCICGVLIAIGIAICVKECYRRKHASSFNLLDVPDVNLKLEDFTLTRIPRPRTIYKEPSSTKNSCSRGGPGNSAVYADLSTEASNGHAKGSSNGTLHPSDLHLRIREHSDGIIVGVTASMSSSNYLPSYQTSAEETEGFINGSARRGKARIRTPTADYTSEGECPASERLLATHHQGEAEGTPNPVFVDEQEEEEKSRKERGGAL